MTTGVATRPEPNVRLEMKGHRERLKQAVHPGLTQREAGFTDAERARLVGGVCEGLADCTDLGTRWAHRILVVLAVALLLALGAGVLKDRWAETRPMQTVEAGR